MGRKTANSVAFSLTLSGEVYRILDQEAERQEVSIRDLVRSYCLAHALRVQEEQKEGDGNGRS